MVDEKQQAGNLVPIDEHGRIDADVLSKLRDEESSAAKERRRCWWFVVWPESCNISKLLHVMRDWGFPVAVSPLHNRDVRDDGEPDKDHYHILVRFPNAKSLESVRRIVGEWLLAADGLVGQDKEIDPVWYVRPVNDYATALRYMCHLDTPEKAQYSVNEVIVLGYLDVSMLYAKSLADDVHAFAELLAWCRNHPKASFQKLCDYVFDSGDGILLRALRNNTYVIRSYMSSRCNESGEQVEEDNS